MRAYFKILILTYFSIVSIHYTAHAQPDDYVKSYLNVNDGLSQNEVTAIGEDKMGFMWFGTRGGLNRYDGYDFKIFKPDRQSESSIINPSVECLYFDNDGKAWIGTKSGGISIYDPLMELFLSNDSLLKALPDRIVSVYQDFRGVYWIGGFYDGLNSYDPEKKEVKNWFSSSNVGALVQTPDSTLWVGAEGNLWFKKPGEDFKSIRLNIPIQAVTEILIDPENPWLWFSGWGLPLVRFNYEDFTFKYFYLPNDSERIYSLLIDKNRVIWVGTWGDGLFQFDPETSKFKKMDLYPDVRHSKISDYNIILDLYEDTEGLIWVGTDGGGVVLLSPSNGFNSVSSFDNGKKYHVTSLLANEDESVIIGTRNYGVLLSRDMKTFESIGIKGETREEASRNVYYISYHNEELTWVGMEKGLYVLEQKESDKWEMTKASDFYDSPELNMQLNKVLSVLQKEDELWVATQQRGLYYYKKKGTEYKLLKRFNKTDTLGGIENNRITSLQIDQKGRFWAASYNGLYRYEERDSVFVLVTELLEDSEEPLCNIILCTHIDAEDNLWFGTPCGLNKLFTEDGGTSYKLREYTMRDGLSDDYICSILEDAEDNIWLSTNVGISKLNKIDGHIYNFQTSDGTGDYNFSESAGFKSKNGVLYFGSYSGLTYFNPDEIVFNNTKPPIAITSFSVMNQEVKVSPDGILPVSINYVDNIVLGHKDKEISIEFAALDYKSSGRNQYQYMLERNGVEGDWEYLGNRRMISYQYLKPGYYTLYLKGSNSNGLWNENTRDLHIRVLASPLERWYAILAYILFVLMIFALIIRISMKQERLKNEANIERIKFEQGKQMNEYKLRFFTNISHEFRTPLSLILAPVDDIMRNESQSLSRTVLKKLKLVETNANRLLKLINQLIEFRKAEAGRVKLEAAEQEIVSFIKEIIQPFAELAKFKSIDFKVDFRIKKALVYFDARKLSVILNNLINNAFKYCGEPGHVKIILDQTDHEISISFLNNSKVIPAQDIDHIFDRFFQVSSSTYPDSSGIGLALVKNYVDMHKAIINVDSSPDGTTKFEVRLKKGREHLIDEEISDANQQKIILEDYVKEIRKPSVGKTFRHLGTKGDKILVIDDNIDVRDYLYDLLSSYYDVTLAENGRIGFEKALETMPDLILSDIMMPEMDGYELCEKIKFHDQLSFIPFVMLTAKDTSSDMIFGARKGADYYITKPFNPELLLEKIRQILSSRKQLAGKYSRKIFLDPVDKEITPENERVLKSAIKIIEKNIENNNLNLDMLADEMAMSSSTLYRKMKAMCGQSPGEFIRTIRFKRAAQLLRDSDLAVSEIIEQVGYNSMKQFRKNFKSEYGMSPASYRMQFKEGGVV